MNYVFHFDILGFQRMALVYIIQYSITKCRNKWKNELKRFQTALMNQTVTLKASVATKSLQSREGLGR